MDQKPPLFKYRFEILISMISSLLLFALIRQNRDVEPDEPLFSEPVTPPQLPVINVTLQVPPLPVAPALTPPVRPLIQLPKPPDIRISQRFIERLPVYARAIFIAFFAGLGLYLLWTHWHPTIDIDPQTLERHVNRGWWVIGIALIFIGALVTNIRPVPYSLLKTPEYGVGFFTLSALGLYCIMIMTLKSTPNLTVFGYKSDIGVIEWSLRKQFLWYSVGLILFVVGMMRPGEPYALVRGLRRSIQQHKWEWLLVFFITCGGFLARTYKLESLIPYITSDEPMFLVNVSAAQRGEHLGLAGDMFFQQTQMGSAIHSYIPDLIGNSRVSARLPYAIRGTLAIPAAYLLARRIMNAWAGALAALFLMTQHVHVGFSRIAIYNIIDPTIGIFAILALWSGFEKGGRWKFALAGVLVGFSQYFYTASRLWFPLFGLWIVLLFLRDPGAIKRHWANMVVFSAAVAIAMIPALSYYKMGYLPFNNHALEMTHGEGDTGVIFGIDPEDYVYQWLGPALRVFFDRGDRSYHYEMYPHTPINLRIAMMVFCLGIAYCFRFALHPLVMCILMWLGLTVVLGGSLMHYVGFTRYVIAMPAMAIVAGLGLAWFSQALMPLFGKHKPLNFLLTLVVIFAVNGQDLNFAYNTYPSRLMRQFGYKRWLSENIIDATLAIPRENDPQIFWVVDRHYDLQMIQMYTFLNGKNDIRIMDQKVDATFLSQLDLRHDTYIFVPPVEADSLFAHVPPAPQSLYWVIQEFYPEAKWIRFDAYQYPTDKPPALYTLVYIPARPPAVGGG